MISSPQAGWSLTWESWKTLNFNFSENLEENSGKLELFGENLENSGKIETCIK